MVVSVLSTGKRNQRKVLRKLTSIYLIERGESLEIIGFVSSI